MALDFNDRPNMGIGGITPAQKLKMAAYVLRPHPAKNGGIAVELNDSTSGWIIGYNKVE